MLQDLKNIRTNYRIDEKSLKGGIYPSEMLLDEYRKYLDDDPKEHVVADYIAGMSDTYAVSAFRRLFIPKGWTEEGI